MISLECSIHNCDLICAGIENDEHRWMCPVDKRISITFAVYHNRVDTFCCKDCKLRWELTSKEDDDNGGWNYKINKEDVVVEKI